MEPQTSILIVDDSEFDRKVISSLLQNTGFSKISFAASAAECRTLLKSNEYDLVLLDIHLSDGSGSEILREVRIHHSSLQLPIIMVTGTSDSHEVAESLKAGANDYIVKPIDPEVAAARIGTQVKLRELSQQEARLKQIEILHAMIITYNHELNSPLAAALLCLEMDEEQLDESQLTNLRHSVRKIAAIVEKIRDIITKDQVDLVTYVGQSKMVRIVK